MGHKTRLLAVRMRHWIKLFFLFFTRLCAQLRAVALVRPFSMWVARQGQYFFFHIAPCALHRIRATDLCESSCESLNSPIERTLFHNPGKDTGRAFLPCELGCGLSVCTSLWKPFLPVDIPPKNRRGCSAPVPRHAPPWRGWPVRAWCCKF